MKKTFAPKPRGEKHVAKMIDTGATLAELNWC